MSELDKQELLELLDKNNITAHIEPSNRGPVLKVYYKYYLNNINDYKGLIQRLINFKELDIIGL